MRRRPMKSENDKSRKIKKKKKDYLISKRQS